MRASLSRLLAALALLTLGWLASGMAPSAAQAPGDAPVTRWEYTSRNVYLPNDADLNLAGSDGWELVTVYLQAKHDYMAVFKRPKP
jgi:hypothetical protein